MTMPSDNMERTNASSRNPQVNSNHRGEWLVAGILIVSVCMAALWMFAGRVSSRPWGVFEYTPRHFAGFVPALPDTEVRRMATPQDPEEVHLFVFDLKKSGGAPVGVRLLHGYNMVDCMRIKWYRVEPLTWVPAGPWRVPPGGVGSQAWRLTDPGGNVSIWMTGVLRVSDLEHSGTDVRRLAFPRVGVPDDISWVPQGMTLASLRHPIRNFRLLLRSKWNGARCDWLTFLRLRRPAWADNEKFTYVVAWHGPSVLPENEQAVASAVGDVYKSVYGQLRGWWGSQRDGSQE